MHPALPSSAIPAPSGPFGLDFPVQPDRAVEEGETPAPVVPQGLRVLLVDDDPMVAETVGEMLQRMGCRARVATDGFQALGWLSSGELSVDLVILDMVMPRMGGAEVFRHLQALVPGLRVVVSSGYSLQGEAQKVLDAGAVGFLQKPFRMRDLVSTVHEALQVRT